MNKSKNQRTKRELLDEMEMLNKRNKKNLEQKAEAMAFLNTAVEIGNKIFCCIPVKMLKIDHDMYQRPLKRSFKYLLENWDNNKCDPITVNYRDDGYYYVIDGQHRVEAAKAKGITQLVCNVFVGLSIKEEADLFAGQYDGTTKLSPYDSYKANILRGEVVDTLLKQTCDKYGILISDRTSQPKTLTTITFARSVIRPTKKCNNRLHTIKQNTKILDWMFSVLREGNWSDYERVYCYDILSSLFYLYNGNRENLNRTKYAISDFLRTTTPSELRALANIEYPECSRAAGVYKILADIVNDKANTLTGETA